MEKRIDPNKIYPEEFLCGVHPKMGTILTVGPNEALIVSGTTLKKKHKTIIIGGYKWVWSCIQHYTYIPLMLITAFSQCVDVETKLGVPLTVSGVAQVKIDRDLVEIAAEQFGGRKISEIRNAISETMEGHLRAILGTLTVEEVLQERIAFAERVKEIADPDLELMGMKIVSFTIRDIQDDVGYLKALGRTRIAEVKREADIATAENNKIAGIREAECEREAMDLIYQSQARTSENSKEAAMKISAYTAEIETAKAQAEMAYSLEEAKLRQRIREEEMQIEVTETRKKIEIEELEIERAELELMTNVRLPADAESYRLEKIAEGEKIQKVATASATGAQIQLIGGAEADSIKNIGNAEAMHRELRATAFKKYNPAATASLVIDAMPLITSHIAQPLGKVDDIVIIGGSDKLTGDLTRLAGQIPPAMQAVAGPQMGDLLRKGLHMYQKKAQENLHRGKPHRIIALAGYMHNCISHKTQKLVIPV